MSPARILIVEDEATIACDIALNLEANGYEVSEITYSAEEGHKALQNNKIDLVMLDINLGGSMTGIDLAEIIDRDFGIPFIYLTSYADKETLDKAAITFPAAYLVKPFKETDLAPAVKMALIRKKEGHTQRLPSIALINNKLISKVTQGEYTIISEIWSGQTNDAIAAKIFISRNTVKTHIRNIYSKLGVHSKPDLLRYLRDLK